MFRKLLLVAAVFAALAAAAHAQNANSGAAGTPAPAKKTTGAAATAQGATTTQEQPAQAPARRAAGRAGAQASAEAAQARAVRDAFDTLVAGIRSADAEAVMNLYWNSPQLVLFNNNGTVTKTWEQASSNRESLYAKVADVKLDVRDVRVKTLGPSAAVVTCMWDQSQTSGGQPERATGRLTLVFQKMGAEWKIVHAHTSPDKPNPSNILPSERTNEADAATPKPPAKP